MRLFFKDFLFLFKDFKSVVFELKETVIGQKQKKSTVILPCSLHDLALAEQIENKNFYKQIDLCTLDSMFLTWFFRLVNFDKKIDRVYGPDLMKGIIENDIKNEHVFLAANSESQKQLKRMLKKQYPQLRIKFFHLNKKMTSKEEKIVLNQVLGDKLIKIIWLGIGSPKQVELASYLKSHSKNKTIFCVGAAFDFLSGRKKQAPLWIQKFGLEWLFRLFNEPKRLWRRYLIIIPKYLLSLLFKTKS